MTNKELKQAKKDQRFLVDFFLRKMHTIHDKIELVNETSSYLGNSIVWTTRQYDRALKIYKRKVK